MENLPHKLCQHELLGQAETWWEPAIGITEATVALQTHKATSKIVKLDIKLINLLPKFDDYAQNSFRNGKGHRKSGKISDKHRNRHEKMDFRRFGWKRGERIKISYVKIFRWLNINLTVKRFDLSNQFERTPEKGYQGQNKNLCVLSNSVIIFRLHTLND
jgi:hypothetical protein